MATRYQPTEIERKWYDAWEESGQFAPSGEGKSYAIMIPPPNVTGSLHMGHAFQDTIMDMLIRYHRMKGDNTLWQPGSDHAGIATQMVVERRLNAQGKTRHDLGREDFIEAIWQWKGESGGNIMRQLRRLGASLDWSRERFTMDEQMSRAVRELFVRWYDEGLIYRGKRLVNWDPVLKTAISDLEVENREEQGKMYHVRYPFVKGQGLDGEYMHIATTRPETILADGALAVHPEDSRYQHLLGKKVHVPMTDRIIPIIADEYVEMDFGTGCVKITPAHDFNDYAVGQRHTMEVINLMNPDATLNENAPKEYQGLDRWVARDKIVADLEAAELLEKIEPHLMKRPYGDRSGVVIEPYLTDQWFVDLTRETQENGQAGGYIRLTKPAIDAVREKRIRFVPENWQNTYFHWMENLQDWCISRQLWWGHRIPAWYDEAGNIYVAENETLVREKYGLAEDVVLTQDEDVLDTWFSSGLWPFATQGWPEQTEALKTFYPGNVLVTGFDIIFFWVARMVLMGLYCMDGEVPFKDVYIHGLVRDANGQKMSKSKGNVIDPIDVIDGIDLEALVAKRTDSMMQPQLAEKITKQTREEYPEGIPPCGTDALRFSFAAQATSGRDILFDIKRVEGYRNFCNKLWNAARFVLMQTDEKTITQPAQLTDAADRWISARLDATIAEVRKAIDSYRFDFAASALYEFIWNDYCDWYLELVKPVLSKNHSDDTQKAHTRWVLLNTLETVLRLAHPIMPFITEEIWQQIAPKLGISEGLLMAQSYPESKNYQDDVAEAEMTWVQNVLLGIRKIRGEMNISPGKALNVLLENAGEYEKRLLAAQETRLKTIGKLESLTVIDGNAPESATAVVGNMNILIPLAGLIDKEAELARLDKEIEKLNKNMMRLEGQLNNEKFTAKAPAELVEQTRLQLAQDKEHVQALTAQREKVAQM
ncbi:valine--tRNA ligase [Suttonella ornithocola]